MPKLTLLSNEAFHAAVRAGGAPEDVYLRKTVAAEIKGIDIEARTIPFVISSAAVDRYGDTVAVDGWKIDNFRKNPVVLWAHDSSALPVAKASYVRAEDGKLKALAEFMPKDISGFANAVFESYRAGFLSATSVGFMPLKYNFVDDPARRYGIDFIEQELLEFSCVPVPANPEALIELAADKSAAIEPLRAWARKLIGSGETKPAAQAAKSFPVKLARARVDALKAQF